MRRRRWLFLSAFLIIAGLVAVFHGSILWAMGSMLVNSETPSKADIVVVLAGDNRGNRMLKGAELVRQGFAPKVFISNGMHFYGITESKAAAEFAASKGYARDSMIESDARPSSTEAEAAVDIPQLRKLGVHSVLLVTSPSHTGRATRLFRKIGPDMEFHPVAAQDPAWCNGFWWTERECRKTWFFEEVKTLTGPFGI